MNTLTIPATNSLPFAPCETAHVVLAVESVSQPAQTGKPNNTSLAVRLRDAIRADHSFAVDAGSVLHIYKAGVYRPETEIDGMVISLCEAWGETKPLGEELANKVRWLIAAQVPELWDRPPLETLNCLNGLLDVRTLELRPHNPAFLSPVQLPVRFDREATCPHIDRFISDVFPADTKVLPYQIFGWLMLPFTSIQKAVLLLGDGANGKSSYLNLVQRFLGSKNCSAISLHKLEQDKFAAARIQGKLVNICADLPSRELSGTSMFKAITGGDAISGEMKFQPSFEFRPFTRLVFSANTPPRSPEDSSGGFYRRWIVVPFDRDFSNDPDAVPRDVLQARLNDPQELSGLLNKALAALPAIQAGKLTESESTVQARNEFRATTDPLSVWLDANTSDDPNGWVEKEVLRKAYAEECKQLGLAIPTMDTFTKRLRSLRPKVGISQRRVDGDIRRGYTGIGLKSDAGECRKLRAVA